MPSKRLQKRTRDQVPEMLNLAEDIERMLCTGDFDRAEPSMQPTVGECRRFAGELVTCLSKWLEELNWLVETEHGS